jgi:hypothetical protein
MVKTEMNELVSEFMGLKHQNGFHTCPTDGGGTCTYEFLKYDHSYNWLMLAWHKFRDLKFEEDSKHEMEHYEFKQNITGKICYGAIESAFESLVSAIQWYNSINKQP